MTRRDIHGNSEKTVDVPFVILLGCHGQCDAKKLTILSDIGPFPFVMITPPSVGYEDFKPLNRAAEFTRQFNTTGLDFRDEMKHCRRLPKHLVLCVAEHPLGPGVNEIDHPINVG